MKKRIAKKVLKKGWAFYGTSTWNEACRVGLRHPDLIPLVMAGSRIVSESLLDDFLGLVLDLDYDLVEQAMEADNL